MRGAIEKAYEIKEKEGNVFIPNQFSNESNFMAHYNSTALEILRDFEKVDAFCGWSWYWWNNNRNRKKI